MLILKLLTCQEVANLASDYLDKHTNQKLSLKIRVHLMMCANCSRFVKHLRLTTATAATLVSKSNSPVDAEAILKKAKERS